MISISFHGTPAAGFKIAARSVASRLSGWAYRLLTWSARRAAIKSLHQLNDRELKDIGLYREQIESAVYGFIRAGAERGRFG
jgi:uncharacterized protein YjiS (DUF1127 family)